MTRNLNLLLLVFYISGLITGLQGQSIQPTIHVPYYPLAQGNVWKYQVHIAGEHSTSTVEWRVTSAKTTNDGIIYQVWPFPSQSDDEAMSLRVTAKGIIETDSGLYLLKSTVKPGESWGSIKTDHRSFRVLSASKPCHVREMVFSDCIVIEDQDDRLQFITVTTFARDIGPVLYSYYAKSTNNKAPLQTVELVSYLLK